MTVVRALQLFMLLTLSAVAPAAMAANPSSENPNELLEVRNEPTSTELATQAGVLFREASEELARYETNLAEGKYKAGDSRELKNIGLTANKITQLQRQGERLKLLAEPAGVDLVLRAEEMQRRQHHVVTTYRKLPNSAMLIANSVSAVQNLSKTKARLLPRVGGFFRQGKVDLAEKGLDEILDELEPFTVWYVLAASKPIYAPITPATALVYPKANELRAARAQEQLSALRDQQQPTLTATLAEIDAALAAVRTSGKAMWRGSELEGPALLAAWVDAWEAEQTKFLRTRAIDWARGIKTGARPPSELDQLEADYANFETKLIAAVGQLPAADAQRAIPDAVPHLYTAYLDAIATATPRVAHKDWLPTVEPGLTALAGKSPPFSQQVESYREATSDILRWRKRAAEAAARARSKSTAGLAEVWKKAGAQNAMVARQGIKAKSTPTYLSTGAPSLVRDVATVTLKQSATLVDLAPGGAETAVSRYRDRLTARLPGARLPPAELTKLKSDLLVAEGAPPLTLEAAIALRSAEAGYFQAAGGVVTGLELQSVIHHFSVLPEDRGHTALGPVVADTSATDGPPLDQVMYVFDVQPAWLQHQYVFVELP